MTAIIGLFTEMNRLCKLDDDFQEAAGELLIDLPEPGTDLAKVICANAILKQEVSKLRKVERVANQILLHYAVGEINLGLMNELREALEEQ